MGIERIVDRAAPALCLLLAACAGDTAAPPPASAPAHTLITLPSIDGANNGASPVDAGQTLSRDELKTCVQQQRRIDRDKASLHQDGAGLDAQRAALATEDRSIASHRSHLDTRDAAAVDRFNAAVNAHMIAVNTYNQAVALFRGKQADDNGVVDNFNSACAGHSYYSDDMAAVTAELGDAPSAPGTSIPLPPSDPLLPPPPGAQ